MKVDIEGEWRGLAHHEEWGFTRLDYYSSTPDNWEIGYDIVFRLVFLLPKDHYDNPGLKTRYEVAFRSAFGLSDRHFETISWGPESVFWRVYWDEEGFDLSLIGKCFQSLNDCAEENNNRVVNIGVTIIPRSMSHIKELVKENKVKSQ